ncbi:MAG: TonB-dependent receptor, partial [Bacteroidota bacterium]
DLRVKSPSENQTLIKGGIGFVSTKLSVETPLIKDKLHILAAGRVAHNGFIFRLMDRLKNTKASFWDTTVKLNYRPNDRNQISATGFFSHDFNQLDIGSTINNVVATSNQNQYQMLNGTLNWLHTLGNQSVLRTTFVSSDYQPSLLFPQPDRTEKIVYQSRIQYQSWMQEWTSAQKEPLALTFGTQANRYQLSPGALLTNNIDGLSDFQLNEEISYELAGYAHANWEMSPKFSVSAGLRFTQYLLTGPFQQANYSDVNLSDVTSLINFEKGEKVIAYNGLEPRIGWRWQLSNNTAIKGNYDQTDQYFQNIYNSTTPLPTSRWKSADAYIKPQRGTTYSLGIYQNFKNDEFAVNVEGYYRTVKNVLDYQPGADFFLQAFIERAVQQGDGKAYGVELGINKPNGTINGWLNYTWSRSLRQFSAQSLKRRINNNRQFASDFDQPHVVNGVLNWEPNDFNTISFNFTYQTGRPYTIANGTFEVNDIKIPIFIERNNDRLPDYHRLDFSWRIHNFNMKTDKRWVGDWVFTVYNLYGRQNAYNWYYTQRDGGRLSEVFSDSPLGAFQLSIFSSPVFSLGYSFRFQ